MSNIAWALHGLQQRGHQHAGGGQTHELFRARSRATASFSCIHFLLCIAIFLLRLFSSTKLCGESHGTISLDEPRYAGIPDDDASLVDVGAALDVEAAAIHMQRYTTPWHTSFHPYIESYAH